MMALNRVRGVDNVCFKGMRWHLLLPSARTQVASHSKKRPHNLTFARMFNHQLFDMLEVGVTSYVDMAALKAGGRFAPQVGSKPCFAFIGSDFDTDPKAAQLKSLLLDFFRGEVRRRSGFRAKGECLEAQNLRRLDCAFLEVPSSGKISQRSKGEC